MPYSPQDADIIYFTAPEGLAQGVHPTRDEELIQMLSYETPGSGICTIKYRIEISSQQDAGFFTLPNAREVNLTPNDKPIEFVTSQNEGKKVVISRCFIDTNESAITPSLSDLPQVIASLAENPHTKDANALLFPIGLTVEIFGKAVRNHALCLAIFKKPDNSIEAVLIDSTGNQIGINHPLKGTRYFAAAVTRVINQQLAANQTIELSLSRILCDETTIEHLNTLFNIQAPQDFEVPINVNTHYTQRQPLLNPGRIFTLNKSCVAFASHAMTRIAERIVCSESPLTLDTITGVASCAHVEVERVCRVYTDQISAIRDERLRQLEAEYQRYAHVEVAEMPDFSDDELEAIFTQATRESTSIASHDSAGKRTITDQDDVISLGSNPDDEAAATAQGDAATAAEELARPSVMTTGPANPVRHIDLNEIDSDPDDDAFAAAGQRAAVVASQRDTVTPAQQQSLFGKLTGGFFK